MTAAVVRRDTGPTHGVIYLPGKGLMVEAARGHGCRVNGELVRLQNGQVLARWDGGRVQDLAASTYLVFFQAQTFYFLHFWID